MSSNNIALALKSAREYRGLKQPRVAKLLGITYQALSNYERSVNRVPVDILQKLCAVYDISSENVLRCELWEDDYYEDFSNASSVAEQIEIISNLGHADPRLICQYCDLLKLKAPERHMPDNLSAEDWELIKAYHAADEKSRAMVDLALAEYKEKAARSEEQAG